ncbi:DUF5719 family protein [Embleya hyalina]|uniref:Secreted protein n=1 Tax=Embleya hyalina TaxID=516124 RepID=A0A401Z6S2_9ACTN|nr:DUF5719 family protein [Embleya hyalina]GCE02557.1 hypothetical protein EHYA_10334 [Embleya hyalina]
MKRTTLSLAAVVALLAVVVGLAVVTRPTESKAAPPPAAARVPVQQAEVSCPFVRQLPGSSTTVSALAPPARAGANGGEANVVELGDRTKVRTRIEAPGKPASVGVDNTDVQPLLGTASGAFAPGFGAGAITRVPSNAGRGLAGVTCEASTTDRWFVGAATTENREAYLYLSNSRDTPAVVDVELFGRNGPIESEAGRGMSLAPGASTAILLRTLNPSAIEPGLAVHVIARSGRVGAAIRDQEGAVGTDWLPSTGAPGRNLVITGLPAITGDAGNVQLMLFSPSGESTDVQLSVAGKVNTFKPVEHETTEVKGNKLTVFDLGPVNRGDAGALRLVSGRADIIAGVRVVQGAGTDAEVAFLSATPELTGRAVIAENRTGGAVATTVTLTAPKGPAKVKLTAFGDKGDPVSADVEVPAGTTVQVNAPAPAGATRFALIAEPQPGSQPVHLARTVTETMNKTAAFTVQPFAPGVETVVVPNARQDLSLLVPQR